MTWASFGSFLSQELCMASRVRAKATGRNELEMKPLGVEEIGKRPMVVARRFKTNPNGQGQTVQKLCKGPKFLGCVLHTKLLSTLPPGASIRASWRSLATSMATQTTASGVLCGLVMVGPSPLVNAEHTHSTGDLRLTMNQHGFRSLRSLQPCWSTPLVSKNSLVPEVLRPGVRGEGTAEVAGESGHGDAVHRARKPLGERLL